MNLINSYFHLYFYNIMKISTTEITLRITKISTTEITLRITKISTTEIIYEINTNMQQYFGEKYSETKNKDAHFDAIFWIY